MKFRYVRINGHKNAFFADWKLIQPQAEDVDLYREIDQWFREHLPFREGICFFKTENNEALRTMIEPAMSLLEKYNYPFDAVFTNFPGAILYEDHFWIWTKDVD